MQGHSHALLLRPRDPARMPHDWTQDRRPLKTWVYAGVILAISVVYYGLYISVGFSTADEGNYAQIAYELFLGRAPGDLTITYGILWFKAGEALFHIFGVQIVAVKAMFFAAITATNVLIFLTIALATGNRLFALVATSVPLFVPAFPPTAFYGLCIAVNAAAQMNMARRIDACTWRDVALAGFALAVSFQLRPDFGYIWTVPFILLVTLALRSSTKDNRIRILAGAVGAFILAHVPVLLLATAGGYIDIVAQQYVNYPATMIRYALGGLQVLVGGSGGVSDTLGTTALQRPGLSNLFTAGSTEQTRAILVYAPVAAILIYAGVAALDSLKGWQRGDVKPLAVASVAGCAGVAAFPHYFFYRPDVSHIANFMPGFVVLASALMWRLSQHPGARTKWQLTAKVAGVSLVTAHLVFYVGYGLTSAATGSIGVATERETPLTIAERGTVLVSRTEHAQLTAIDALIRENSTPDDRIVCVPYCPGYAFLTGRRMLFDYFYVDDSIPLIDPDWLPQAIATTQREKPPVVIVMDWAINGTERSRFDNWGAAYMNALKPLVRETRTFPGLTVYLL